jgi:hypothetical protein
VKLMEYPTNGYDAFTLGGSVSPFSVIPLYWQHN